MTRIEQAEPQRWAAALNLALSLAADEERPGRVLDLLAMLARGDIDPRGLWIARAGDTVVGVQFCVLLGGKSCQFWLPQAAGDHALAEELVRAGLAWCWRSGGALAQAMLPGELLPEAAPLLRAGFRNVTQMVFLQHNLLGLTEASTPMRFETFDEAGHDRFTTTLGLTYEGTLDCPELNGARSHADILAGHRAAGLDRPGFWWLACDDDQPVGVVLLTEPADRLAWDLAYVGVVPEHRRRGVGRALVLHALHAAAREVCTRLTVAVDVRNAPARRLYESLGFVLSDTREVLLCLRGWGSE